MKLTVFGANGAIGQAVVREAVKAGHEVIAVARRQGTLDKSPAQHKAYGLMTDANFVRQQVVNSDVVISAVGPSLNSKRQDKTTPVADGLAVLVAVMEEWQSKRLIINGTPTLADRHRDKNSLVTLVPKVMARLFLPAGYREMKKMQAILEQTSVDWTVVRFLNPNLKSDGVGYTYAFGDSKAKFSVSRQNIAKFMVYDSYKSQFSREMPIVFNR
ncbi:NAD(P)H-binding protein [Streptococcus caprae]|uniref:NAD(P)H-binding protein n=1 Tax=Streptococcus caprae TaxID=1640501 RepID=A0ABV8CWU9_9STRE